MSIYLNNKDLLREVKRSKELGSPTPEFLEMIQLMVKNIVRKLRYCNYEDKKDCEQFAIYYCIIYFNKFDETVSENAFSYFTQVIKNGLAQGWKRLHPIPNKNKVNISNFYSFDGGEK